MAARVWQPGAGRDMTRIKTQAYGGRSGTVPGLRQLSHT